MSFGIRPGDPEPLGLTLTADGANIAVVSGAEAIDLVLHEDGSIDLTGTGTSPFQASLYVRVSVIGRNWPGRVTCDAGNKHFSAKGTLPAFVATPAEGAVYRPDSDEHGIIELPADIAKPALGTAFELVVPHCDPTVNLYDHYHVVEGDTLIDIWPIEARGAF